MIFSSTTEYAMRGLSELAARGVRDRILLDDLVAGTDLPRDFMAKIFQRLARAGVLVSAKGRGGGFALARPAHAITLMQVVEALDGPEAMDRCVMGLGRCGEDEPCAQHDLYKPIRQRLKDYLGTTTLADLGASLRANPAWRKARDGRLAAASAAPVEPTASFAPVAPVARVVPAMQAAGENHAPPDTRSKGK